MPPAARSRSVFHCARPSSASRCTTRKTMSHAPSPICGLEGKKTRGESGSERREYRRSAQAALKRALKHKKHTRCRHVAMIAQDFAFVAQRSLLQFKCGLNRVDHL